MNDMFRRELVSLGDLCVTSLATVEHAALRDQLRAGRPMNRTIHASPTEQAGVGSIDDGVAVQRGDVGTDSIHESGGGNGGLTMRPVDEKKEGATQPVNENDGEEEQVPGHQQGRPTRTNPHG